MDADRARQILEDERTRLQAALDSARSDTADIDSSARDDSTDAADTESMERSVGLVETHEAQLAAVDEALARLDAGTYGRCEACGEAIPDERLEAMPTARYHAEHEPSSTGVVAPPR